MVRFEDTEADAAGDSRYNQHQKHESDLHAGHIKIWFYFIFDVNVSLQDKSFLSMLGNIRYNEWGQVVGAGAVEVD